MILALLACTSPEGSFVALTYNIAGLPEGLSSSDPERFIPQMGTKMNDYDLVLVQEDFSYHDLLAPDVTLPYASVPKVPATQFVGDGLNRFSVFPFEPVERTQWIACHGVVDSSNDCLSEKGFSIAPTELAKDVWVTVVNLHAEAGGGEPDMQARADNFEQLAAVLEQVEGPVIVGGDTNLKPSQREPDGATLAAFLERSDLVEVEQQDPDQDHIDRWFYRSTEDFDILPSDWAVADEFVSAEGEDLSDHPAIRTRFTWSVR